MINKNIIIAALARNCEESLKTNIALIEDLRARFLWSQVVVVENDSVDNTKALLREWEQCYENVAIISNDFGTKTIPDKGDLTVDPYTSYQRIEKMARYRNLYLDFIQDIQHSIDLVIVIDIDVIEISLSGLLKIAESFDEKTGAIFANGVSVKSTPFGLSEVYYDIFAVWEYPMQKEFSHSPDSLARTFKSVNRRVNRTPFYPVISAFGGVGVYNYEAMKDLRYRTLPNPLNELEAICEHISFNQAIVKRGFQNYIARDFKVVYQKHNWILILKLMLPAKVFKVLHPIVLKFKKEAL